MKCISLEPKLEEWERLNSFINEEFSLDCSGVNLIVEELFVNIVNYSGCTYIKVFFEYEGNVLKMVFVDDGTRFNPLLNDDPDFPDDVMDAKIGGLGIHLVKSVADEISYEYVDEENRLMVLKSVENEE